MKKIIIGFIILCFLIILIKALCDVVKETAKVMQYAPHIMDTPPGIDLSDTMVFYNNKK